MRDISLHILDLAQNSITAGALQVEISLNLDGSDVLTLSLEDNGCGMDEEMLKRAQTPFGTTRTTRKVGLGIPLTMENARLTGGDASITSQKGVGTKLTASFHTRSIDCLPLGDIAGTMLSLIASNPEKPDFVLMCSSPKGEFKLDTVELKQVLEGLPLNNPEVMNWIFSSVKEEVELIFGGIIK